MRNLYVLREAQALPESKERLELSRARRDGDRIVDALEARELGLPTFLVAGAIVPVVAAIGRITGVLHSTLWGTVIGVVGMLIALAASWVILRGTALASRRIRLATTGPGAGPLGRDRLVRHPSARPDADVRDRLARADDRRLDHRPDPRRDRAHDVRRDPT